MKTKLYLDRRALYCDETSEYRYPVEPDAGDEIVLRFRTGRDNVDQIYVIFGTTEAKMEKSCSVGDFDFYEVKLPVEGEMFSYFFEISKGKELCFYNKLGCTTDLQEFHNFTVTPGFKTPKWAKGAVFYQIFVDRFRNGNTLNDPLDREYIYIGGHTKRIKDWNKYPDSLDVRCFYGGDLQGVKEKLDYLQNLGVEVLYFNPLFVSPSNHKYDIQDYDYIDPHFAVIVKDEGNVLDENQYDNSVATKFISRIASKENLEASNEFFVELVEEIHKRGMKVILDGVFNHCGSFNKWLDRERLYENVDGYEAGAYITEKSPYHTFFHFHSERWPYNPDYDGWWGYETLPKLNYEESKELYRYVLEVAKKWVAPPYNVDGWRLDVAADLGRSNEFNHRFWHDFRQAVKSEKPDAIILAEHYGDPTSWLMGDQWDTVMNYDAFMEPVTWFLTGMEKHSDESNQNLYGNGEWFFSTMAYNMSKFQYPSLEVAMNELSNHDHSRFLTRTNRKIGRTSTLGPEAAGSHINKGVLREAVVIQMTWPGAPTIYYGDEAGQVGWTDPDNRRTFPWGKEDWELIEFHRYMIHYHKAYDCLRRGSYKPLISGNHLIVYGRFCKENKAVIAVNNKAENRNVQIPVWEIEVPEDAPMMRIIETSPKGYNVGKLFVLTEKGYLNITLAPVSAVVFVVGEPRSSM